MNLNIDLQQVYLLQSEALKDKTLTFICEYFRHHGPILITNGDNRVLEFFCK